MSDERDVSAGGELMNPSPVTEAELPPFEPPDDFDHGEAFASDPPRAIPPSARKSRFVAGRRTVVWTLLTLAAACWVTAPLPFVRTLSWYLLPLGYLDWCGLGLAVLAGFIWLRNATTVGRLEYYKHGEALVGRVLAWGINAEGTNDAPQGRFVANVEFRHPETNQLETRLVADDDVFPLGEAAKRSCGVERGDYLTLVYLPRDFDKTLRIHGWQGIDPDRELMSKNGKQLKPMSPVAALLIVLAITAAFWCLLSFIYVIGRYEPLDVVWQPYAIGIALASIPFIILMQFGIDRKAETKWPMFARRFGLGLLGVFGGFMVGFPTVGFLNGWLDKSPPQFEPIRVVQLWHTTWNFIVRNYELEYTPYLGGDAKKKTVSVETIDQFANDSLGVIDVGQGALGMRWIRGFHPIIWEALGANAEPVAGEVRMKFKDDDEITRVAPRILYSEQDLKPLPEVMLTDARQRLNAQLGGQGEIEILPDEAVKVDNEPIADDGAAAK